MVYVLLPAYNEEKNILSTIENFRKGLKGHKFKIVAVNDGSTDNTPAILDKARRGLQIEIINNTQNLGVGPVLYKGIEFVANDSSAPDDLLIIAEADDTSDAGIASLMISLSQGPVDIVIASRFLKKGAFLGFPFKRLVLSKFANALLRFFCKIPGVTDYTIFYRLYKVGLLKMAFEKFGKTLIERRGFEANAELLFKLSVFNPTIKEAAFKYNYRLKKSQSKIKIIQTIKNYLVLIKGFMDLKKRQINT